MPDFQAVDKGMVLTDWIYGLGELFVPSEDACDCELSSFAHVVLCRDVLNVLRIKYNRIQFVGCRGAYTSWQSAQ